MIGEALSFFQQNGFVLELLTCMVIFTSMQAKRRCYLLRLLACAAVMLGSAILLNHVSLTGLVYNFLKYLVWFFMAVLSGLFTCRMPFSMALFSGISAYITQHMSFKVGEWVVYFLLVGWDRQTASLAYLLVDVLMYTFCYFVYARRIRTSDNPFLFLNQFGILCVGVAVFTTILQYIFNQYAYQMPPMVCTAYCLLDVVCCLFGLAIQFGLFRESRLAEEKRLLEHIMHLQEEKFRQSKENIELINIKCHDLKRQLSGMRGLEKEELQQLYRTLNIYDMSVKTGNDVLDTILAEKSLICEQEHIHLECMANGRCLHFISTADVYAIFGNAIDNAIESVRKVQNVNQRYISLSIREAHGMAVFHVENLYEGTLQFADGLPMTTKPNKSFHGFGMKSIQMSVEKYGGHLSIVAQDHLFSLNVTIPLKA